MTFGFGSGFAWGAGNQMYSNWANNRGIFTGKNKTQFRLTDVDGKLRIYEVTSENNKYSIGGDMEINNNILSIKGVSIDGNSTNQLGPSGVRDLANSFGKFMNVKEVHFQGSPRTTGANPGKMSTYKHVVK